jgi:hypothetical protein
MAFTQDAIFDRERLRSDPHPAEHDEPTFDFYNRCANEVIGSVRELLDEWFLHYPRGRDRNDLLGRLRSSNRQAWNAGFWELYVHESLRRFGFKVTVHPERSDVARRVDYLAERGSDRVFVECVCFGLPDADVRRRNGIAKLESALDKSGITDYWLALDIDSYGPLPVPPGQLVRGLRRWLDDQDLSAIESMPPGHLPAYRWDRDGWRIRITPIARGPDARGRADFRPLGVMSPEDDERVVWMAIRDLLADKASGYGDLEAPYVIALNAPDVWPDAREAEWAVVGPQPFTESWERHGFLLNRSAEREHVAAVAIGTAVQAHTVARRQPTLYCNPAASLPVTEALRWPRVSLAELSIERTQGVDPAVLFGLTSDWPGDPWP